MDDHSVVGVYKTLSDAETAVLSLGDGGFPIQKVSIIASNLEDDRRVHGYITASDVGQWSAATGAWVGGIFGLLVGTGFMWIPGFGLLVVVGSLSAALLGGMEGSLAGTVVIGALGWLVGLGIAKEKIPTYEAGRQGRQIPGYRLRPRGHGQEGTRDPRGFPGGATGPARANDHLSATVCPGRWRFRLPAPFRNRRWRFGTARRPMCWRHSKRCIIGAGETRRRVGASMMPRWRWIGRESTPRGGSSAERLCVYPKETGHAPEIRRR